MNKQVKHTYGGMSKDISKSKFPNTSYFDGQNFNIMATDNQSSYSISNEKGTIVQITFPDYIVNSNNILISNQTIPYTVKDIPLGNHTNHKLVGSINIKDGIIFFTTGSIDSIWLHKFEDENNIKLIYARDLGFTQDYQISGISNYESEKIEKIYWVDGLHQLRHLNIRHSKDNGDYEDIIDIPTNTIQMVGKANLTQPIIKDITSGGTHTSGVIQYAYSIYRINGGQSQTSPLSEQVPLNNTGILGDNINKPSNTAPVVRIENIPDDYTNIRVYAIKYTSFGVPPEVSIIYDQRIPSSGNVEIFDDGSILGSITLSEFLFLSTDLIIPKHINSKDNYMFYANYEEKEFELNLDLRAYSFDSIDPSVAKSRVYSDVESLTNLVNTPVRIITPNNYPDDPNDDFDNINLDFDKYRLSMNSHILGSFLIPTVGGTGKYLTYEVIPTTVRNTRNKYFKDSEIYRIAIEFYNEYGKKTKPIWIGDFKAPESNLEGYFNTLKFTFKPAFYTWLNSQTFDDYNKPVGYKLLIAERNAEDRTIVTSGIASTMMVNSRHIPDYGERVIEIFDDTDKGLMETVNNGDKEKLNKTLPKMPNFLLRNLKHYNRKNLSSHYADILWGQEHNLAISRDTTQYTEIVSQWKKPGTTWQYNKILQLFSPDTIFNNSIPLAGGLRARIKGYMKNTFNSSYFQQRKVSDDSIVAENIEGNWYSKGGAIAHPGTDDPAIYRRDLYYREYGLQNGSYDNFSSDIDGYYYLVNPYNITNFVQRTNLDNDYADVQVNNTNTIDITIKNKTANNLYYKFKPGFLINLTANPYGSLYRFSLSVNGVVVQTKADLAGNTVFVLNNMFNQILRTLPTNSTDTISLTVQVKPNVTPNGGNFVEGIAALIPGLNNTDILEISTDSNFNTGEEAFYTIDQIPVNFKISTNVTSINPLELPFTQRGDFLDIYGTPELTLRGQTVKAYNNDNEYKYMNTLQPLLTGSNFPTVPSLSNQGIYQRKIISIDSDVNSNVTFIMQKNGFPYMIEEYWNADIDSVDNVAPIIELVKSKEDIYLGGIYGGNSFEDKKRTKYTSIGNYNKIDKNVVQINSPGDTFVQTFTFLRVVRRDDSIINEGTQHIEEIVSLPIETTIDLENRNDVSSQEWSNKISYSNEEFHYYNKVYSQPNNLMQVTGDEYNTKQLNFHETRVNASKLKTSGEVIDNWLDMLPNETIDLDGKFGPISNLLYLNDELYTLQDRAFSKLSINPRVQVQGNDGVSIELGSGTVLQDYQYISTDIGCKNKFGSTVTPYGIYFYDNNNKRINQFNGQIKPISEIAGLHSFLYSKDLKSIDMDKPLKGEGMSIGYDYVNNQLHMSFLTLDENFTLKYTEKGDLFVNNNDYGANHYASMGDYIYSNLSDNKIHRHNKGKYNEYYGENKPTKVTLMVNPEADLAITVNNIIYKSEAYLNGIDQSEITLTHIRAYNEYQDSGQVELVNNRRGNIQRLFREWNAQIPRVEGKRERIRNPWTYLELTFNNIEGYEFILHDMIVSYTI